MDMTSKPKSPDAFEDDDDFFMSEVYEDERDRSNSLVYVEAELEEDKTISAKEEANNSPPAAEHSLGSDFDGQDPESESDEDILIIGESKVAVVPSSPEPLPKRRLRSQTSQIASTENSRPSVPLLPLTRSKRQKPAGRNKKAKSTANGYSTNAKSQSSNSLSAIAQSSKDNTPQNIYKVQLLSRLDGSIGKVIEVKVLGQDEFTSILKSVLDGILKEGEVPEQLRKQYSVESVTLYWNNAKLLKFMTCDSLRVDKSSEEDVVDVEITMVNSEREQEYEQQLRSRIMRVESASLTHSDTITGAADDEFEVLEIDQADQTVEESNKAISETKKNHSNTIKVALVGRDNKKLYVQVRSSTPFSKVAEYYKEQKLISKDVQIKLIFDHEELDLSDTIGEQDMEDEDMIEVLI